MSWKIILAICGTLVLAVAVFAGNRYYTKSFSPEAVASFEQDKLKVRVKYCQPAKKGRLIFGREKDKALVPYDRVWRTGANEATLITFSAPVQVAGTRLAAGTYSLWSIPGPARWHMIFNGETGQWGTQYNDGMDIARLEVPIWIDPKVRENFEIYFEEAPDGKNMIMSWDQTEVIVPIRID